jgi:luciferase family oxidoreductase group 1
MRLGVIDLQQPWWMPTLAPHVDQLGYSRYWTTEHHGSRQSASPTLMAALAAGLTERLRVGTAGILLELANPLRIVQDFNFLETMFPGRIDLGLVGASVPEPFLSALLDGAPVPDRDTYERKARTLVELVRGRSEAFPRWRLGPATGREPEVWICGSSARSATLAGKLGVSYSVHDFLLTCDSQESLERASARGPESVRRYLDQFVPSSAQRGPTFNVTCFGICADTEARAAELWRLKHARDVAQRGAHALPRASFLGTPAQCAEQLAAVAARYEAGEIIVQSLSETLDDCLRSYSLLAEALLGDQSREPAKSTST